MAETTYCNYIDGCLSRWSSRDERTEKFQNEFESWISQLPDEIVPIALKLIELFDYYPHNVTNRTLSELHAKLMAEYNLNIQDTIYTFIKSKHGEGNSSVDYWVEYKNINRINKNICFMDTTLITEENWGRISNIVIIDDCTGSGKTIIDYVKARADRFVGKNIYFIIIHAMEDAIKKIEDYTISNHINIVPIYKIARCGAFSNPVFGENVVAMKELFIKESARLRIPDSDILGFQSSESLMAFYNNTPNNTLGLFRMDTENYRSLFPRSNDLVPDWQKENSLGAIIEEKKKRKARNYNSAKRGNICG